jgi:hypothetical protein
MSRELPSHHGESRTPRFRKLNALTVALCLAAVISGLALPARADVIEMQNGDRYNGKVLSVNTNSLILESEVLGTITLPRGKVSLISLGTDAATNRNHSIAAIPGSRHAASPAKTNGSPARSSAFGELGAQTNLIRQVKSQFLSDAGPEANEKFDELMGGLISGKLTVADLRVEAKSAADQVRALQKELGPDASGSFDAYLAILDHFVSESAPPAGASTNAPAASSKLKSKSLLDDD